jgi:RNA polymerase sigma factor (sigma-70 family)
MQELADTELLRQYAHQNSEAAFAALVTRHVPLVYSAALRKTGNPSAAEEVTQAVFVILARKARGLRRETALAGWLYQTTRLMAANILRTEIRRARREQEALMQSLSNETGPETWRQIMPLLEDAMGRLGERERNAVVLRFFEGKSFQEIGAAVGATENAAKKRVGHALEKLRKFFLQHGVDSTAAAIGETLSAHSIQAVPVGLAKTVSTVALAKGAAASASTLTLIKGALKIMAWTKAKTVVVVGAAILLAGGTMFVAVEKDRDVSGGYFWQVFDPSRASLVLSNAPPKATIVRRLPKGVPPNDLAPAGLILSNTPPQVTIVPTRFPKGGMLNGVREWGWMNALRNGEAIGMNCSAEEIIRYAMSDYPPARTMVDGKLPERGPKVPERGYDFIASLPNGSRAALKAEVERKFGLTENIENRQTDVLILRVKSATARDDLQGTRFAGDGGSGLHAVSTSELASGIEPMINVPVVDETGLTNHFKLTLKWGEGDKLTGVEQFNRSLDKIGLELVPGRRPVEMLVVEKAK